MGLFIGILAVIAVAVIAVFLGGIFKSSLKAGSKDAASASRLPSMTAEDSAKLSDARRSIVASRQLVMRIHEEEAKRNAEAVLEKAERIIATMKNQPDEIRRAKQFFGYYLPSINTVVGKFVELESSGMDVTVQKDTVMSYLADVDKAFDVLYENMFKDEKLDLEVETEAMQVALKRDGLL